MKHLTGISDNWPMYCKPAMLVYKSYATPNVDNLSLFEMAIGQKALLVPRFEFKPKTPITGTHAQAKEKLPRKVALF